MIKRTYQTKPSNSPRLGSSEVSLQMALTSRFGRMCPRLMSYRRRIKLGQTSWTVSMLSSNPRVRTLKRQPCFAQQGLANMIKDRTMILDQQNVQGRLPWTCFGVGCQRHFLSMSRVRSSVPLSKRLSNFY